MNKIFGVEKFRAYLKIMSRYVQSGFLRKSKQLNWRGK